MAAREHAATRGDPRRLHGRRSRARGSTQLARAKRRPGVAVAIARGAVVAAAVAIVAVRAGGAPVAVCEPPARDVTTVWSPAIAADLRAKTSDAHAAVLDAAYRNWQAVRTAACTAPPQVRQAQLQCLDGVLGRFDTLRQAYLRVPAAAAEDIQGQLIDPEICRKPAFADVPRLTLAPKPDILAAYELYARSATDDKPSDAELVALIGKPSTDPCARMVATLAFDAASKDVTSARTLMSDAVSTAGQCDDERLHADLLIRAAQHEGLITLGPKGEAALKRAQVAARHVMQPDIEAVLASQSIAIARRQRRWEEAFQLVETEIVGYGARGLQARQIGAVITRNSLRIARAESGDLEAIAADVQKWRPIATTSHKPDLAADLDEQSAEAQFWLGDVPAAHAELLRLWRAQPLPERVGKTREIHGEVVDALGHPVAGASVAASSLLTADSVGIGVPLFDGGDNLRITTTDDAGRFVIGDFSNAAQAGAIAAQLADRRSRPAAIADHVRLVLEPTRSVSGKVELGGMPHTRVRVYCNVAGDPTGRFRTIAPVAADGAFIVAGATVGALRVGASVGGGEGTGSYIEYQTQPASPAPITDLRLAITLSTRTLDVIVHSTVATPVDNAEVILFSGKQQISNVGELIRLQAAGVQSYFAKPVTGNNVPRPVRDQIDTGDLVVHVEHAGLGNLTVCAIGYPGDLSDPAVVERLQTHISQLALKCEQIGSETTVVVVAVPPQPRFD